MNKKTRLAIAATVTAAIMAQSPASLAATGSARDFLSDFTNQIGLGQYAVAQQQLTQIANACPGFDGLLLTDGSVISSESLSNIFVAIDNGTMAPGDIVSSLQTVLNTSSTIGFLCNDAQVGPVNLATASSFPVGSAG